MRCENDKTNPSLACYRSVFPQYRSLRLLFSLSLSRLFRSNFFLLVKVGKKEIKNIKKAERTLKRRLNVNIQAAD